MPTEFHYCDGMSRLNREIGRLQVIIETLEDDNLELRKKMNSREYMEIYGEDKAELYREDGDPGSHAYCTECGKECRPQKVDYGIGRTEAWGYVTTHHDYRWVSPCCEAEVEE